MIISTYEWSYHCLLGAILGMFDQKHAQNLNMLFVNNSPKLKSRQKSQGHYWQFNGGVRDNSQPPYGSARVL